MKFVAMFALAFALLAIPSVATADPQISVSPARANCQQPFEVTAKGFAPLKPVEVTLTIAGQAAKGGVGGTSDADGVFISPFPMINMPCESGGVVTATIRVDGDLLDAAATFVVIGRNVTPSPPGTGTGRVPPSPHDGLFVSAIGASVLLLTLLALMLWPRRDRKR